MRIDEEFRRHWPIVLGCFFGLMVSASPGYMSIVGLFLKSYVAEYGWTRAKASSGLMFASFTAALTSPFVGLVIDRFGARRILLCGCIAFPMMLLAHGLIPLDYPRYVALAILTGLAAGVVAPAVYMTLPTQYFSRRLGLAIGFAIVGLGVGQMAMPLVTERLIAIQGEDGAWRVLACLVLAVGLGSTLVLLRDNPQYQAARRAGRFDDIPGKSSGAVVRSGRYWLLSIGFLLLVLPMAACALHLPAILSDRGFPPQAGALAVALIGAGSLVARLATGMMLDIASPAVPATIFFGGQALGILLLASGAGGAAPFAAALLMGCALGAEGDIMPFVLRKLFGMRAFGRIYGLSYGVFQLGVSSGGVIMGAGYDRLNAYEPVLIALSGVTVVGAIMVVAASRPAGAAAAASWIGSRSVSDG